MRQLTSLRAKILLQFGLGVVCLLGVKPKGVQAQQQIPGLYSGRITDSTGAPLPLATVMAVRSKQGVVADLEGYWLLRGLSPDDTLRFRYTGFAEQRIALRNATHPLNVVLKPSENSITEVVITGEENPALRIIRNAIAWRTRNDPFGLPGFRYKAYHKVRMTEIAGMTYDEQFQKLFKRADLFLWENVIQRTWERPDRNTEEVLGTRMSGLPATALPVTPSQFLDFNFYGRRVQLLSYSYPGPIAEAGLDAYRYELQQVLPEGRDTVFVIAFRPRNNGSTNFSGILRIHNARWALLAVEADLPEAGSTGRLRKVKVAQYSKLVNDTLWFPYQYNAQVEVAFQPNDPDKNRVQGIVRTQLKEIEIDPGNIPRTWNGVNLRLATRAAEQDENFWTKYRTDTLSLRERATYIVLDSVSKARGIADRIGLLRGLSQGLIDLEYFKIDIGRIYDVNFVERSRIGIGLHSPDILSKKVALGAWLGYGMGDRRVKWGSYVMLFPFRNPTLRFRYTYASELWEAGHNRMGKELDALFFQRRETRLTFRDPHVRYLDYTDHHRLEFFGTWPRTFYHRVSAVREEVKPAYENQYSFRGRSFFQFFELGYSLRWAPGEKLAQDGNALLNTTRFPILEFRLTAGLPHVLGSKFSYQKYELAFTHFVRWRKVGVFDYLLTAGWLEGELPYTRLYVFMGNGNQFFGGGRRTVWGDTYAFNTMEFARFTADRYATGHFSFTFYNRRFPHPKWTPSLRLLTAIAWGLLRQNSADHDWKRGDAPYFFPLQGPERGYYESGLRLSKLFPAQVTRWIPPLNAMAVGFYYRYGPYADSRAINNFQVKLEWDLTF